MASFNQITLIGYLGQEPDFKTTAAGQHVASFSLSTTDRGYTKANGEQVPDRTDWHRISLFGRLAEVANQYLHKGSQVCVQGSLHYRQYTDKDGVQRTSADITADTLQMLDRKTDNNNAAATVVQSAPQPQQYQQQQYQQGQTYQAQGAPSQFLGQYMQQQQYQQPQQQPQAAPQGYQQEQLPF